MRNIYIDIGAYNGDTVEQFRNWSKIAYPGKDFIIYAFDPNPNFKKQWAILSNDKTTFSNKAAWISDGVAKFAVDDTNMPIGSTLMPSKVRAWEAFNKIEVETFDFSEWLKQFKNDFVVVKMDCEGAEFPILEKMIDDKTITIPNDLMVEFHPNKVVDYTSNYSNKLKDRIRQLGVNLTDWH